MSFCSAQFTAQIEVSKGSPDMFRRSADTRQLPIDKIPLYRARSGEPDVKNLLCIYVSK